MRRSSVRKISSLGRGDGGGIGMLEASDIVAFAVMLFSEPGVAWTTSLAMTSP